MEIQCLESLTPEQCQEIENLEKKVFPNSFRAGHFVNEAPQKRQLLALLGYQDSQLMAYKVGYELKSKLFYSWVGGVHPQYRKQGFAKQLMQRQHQILLERGYKAVQTKTRMGFRGMLILNLKTGFDITGVSTKPHVPGLIIQMEKPLLKKA